MTETNSNPPILSKDTGLRPPPGPFQEVVSVNKFNQFLKLLNEEFANSGIELAEKITSGEYTTLEGATAQVPEEQIFYRIKGGTSRSRNELLSKLHPPKPSDSPNVNPAHAIVISKTIFVLTPMLPELVSIF